MMTHKEYDQQMEARLADLKPDNETIIACTWLVGTLRPEFEAELWTKTTLRYLWHSERSARSILGASISTQTKHLQFDVEFTQPTSQAERREHHCSEGLRS